MIGSWVCAQPQTRAKAVFHSQDFFFGDKTIKYFHSSNRSADGLMTRKMQTLGRISYHRRPSRTLEMTRGCLNESGVRIRGVKLDFWQV